LPLDPEHTLLAIPDAGTVACRQAFLAFRQ
jgi:hypothetical protein